MFRSIMVSAFAILALTSASFAQSTAGSSAGATSGSSSSVAVNNKAYRGTGTAIAPGLASSGISCLASASLGGGWMGGAAALGFTTGDKACNIREDARYINGVTGDRLAAKERLCDSDKIREAFLRAGHPCIEDMNVSRTYHTGERIRGRRHAMAISYNRNSRHDPR